MQYKTNQQLNGKVLRIASIRNFARGTHVTGTVVETKETFTHDFGLGQATRLLQSLTAPIIARLDLVGRRTTLTVLS